MLIHSLLRPSSEVSSESWLAVSVDPLFDTIPGFDLWTAWLDLDSEPVHGVRLGRGSASYGDRSGPHHTLRSESGGDLVRSDASKT
jgi:hypothetical protein